MTDERMLVAPQLLQQQPASDLRQRMARQIMVSGLQCRFALRKHPTSLKVPVDMCRCTPAALPWTFGMFVFLTSLLDFSAGTAAQEFSDWLGSVSPCFEGYPMLHSSLGAVWKGGHSMVGVYDGVATKQSGE